LTFYVILRQRTPPWRWPEYVAEIRWWLRW